jgi:hypothetical protein
VRRRSPENRRGQGETEPAETLEAEEAAEDQAPEDGQEEAQGDLDTTVTWDGEPLTVTGTRCGTRPVTLTPNGYAVEAFFEDSGHCLWAIWDQDDDEPALVMTCLEADSNLAEEELPEGARVEFDISCP